MHVQLCQENMAIHRYTEALVIHTGAITIHLEDNTMRIYVVEAKIVTPKVKHIDIPVCFLLEQFDNGLIVSKD